jgi:tetratricopeptide (TPR) repeat protein
VQTLQTAFELMFLWAAAAAAAGMVVLALRARRLEREHGLARARHRTTIALVVCGLVTACALYGTAASLRGGVRAARVDTGTAGGTGGDAGGADARPGAGPAPTPEELAELKALEERIAVLRKRIEAAKPAAAKAADDESESKKDAAGADEGPGGVPVPTAVLVAVVVVVILGLFLLLALGDPEVLLRTLFGDRFGDSGELRLKARANLDRLTAAADKGEYRAGITHADATDAHLLDRFDRTDWLFLRCFCALQLGSDAQVPEAERTAHLEQAARGLTTVLEEAPNRAEAAYMLAIAQGLLGSYRAALEALDRAKAGLGTNALPFDQNRSVCLLRLAEQELGQGNAEAAGRHFDQVTRLKVLADRIPSTLVRVRLMNVRKNIQSGQLNEAGEGIETLRRLEGLDREQRDNVEAVCDALQALVSVRRGGDEEVLRQIDAYVGKHLPAGLPEPDEELADEYLEPPTTGLTLRLAPQVFGAFLFLKAAALARLAAKAGGPPAAAQVAAIARPLLTALQFELRQRDVLAALGGLYYLLVPEKKRKAVQWLEAAVVMGVESRIARRLLESERRIEAENRDALEWFRSTAGRFLHDPTVSAHVRQALVEELGRFQGFQPLLLELDRQTELEPQEPTIRLLRERAGFMQEMVTDFAARKPAAVQAEFDQLRQEYVRLIAALDSSSHRMSEIERRLVQEIGKTVLS